MATFITINGAAGADDVVVAEFFLSLWRPLEGAIFARETKAATLYLTLSTMLTITKAIMEMIGGQSDHRSIRMIEICRVD